MGGDRFLAQDPGCLEPPHGTAVDRVFRMNFGSPKALYDRLLRMNLDPSFLRAALVGYQNQLSEVEQAMADIRRRLKMTPGSDSKAAPARKRTMSAAARRRIAAAQRKRWAAYKKSKAARK